MANDDDDHDHGDDAVMQRDEQVVTLAAVLGLEEDLVACREKLEASGWDLQRAVDVALGVNTLDTAADAAEVAPPSIARDGGGLRRRHGTSATAPARRRDSTAAAPRQRRPQRTGSFPNPFRFVSTLGFGVVAAAVKLSVGVVDALMKLVLPFPTYARLSAVLTRIACRFDTPATARLSRADREAALEVRAKEFAEWFNESFYDIGSNGLHFLHMSNREALRFAQSETKLLFVYLHSPSHPESDLFCAQVLASREVTEYVNERFVAWGGDVRDAEVYALAEGVRPSAYPYVALLASVSGEVSLVMSCEGFIDTTGLITSFEEALSAQHGNLDQARARNAEAQASRRLREEQDAALAQSLAQDAARAREREAEAAQVEAERAKAEAEARAIEEERRREEEAERARVEAIETRRAMKSQGLREEPEEGVEGVSKLAIRLPDGSRAERRFYSTDTISDVYDFVDTLEQLDSRDYTLLTNFPRRTFDRAESVSLVEAGVHPNGALFVQTEHA